VVVGGRVWLLSETVVGLWGADAPVVSLSSSDGVVAGADESLVVVDNSTVTLLCDVDAYPPVDTSAISWQRDYAFAGLTPPAHLPACCVVRRADKLIAAVAHAQFTPPARLDKTVLSVSCLA